MDQDLDLIAIRQLVADAEAFQGDTQSFTGLLTENVTIVNVAGIRVKGREQFRQRMSMAMQGQLANVLTKNEIVDITFIRPDVAVVGCIKHIDNRNAAASDETPTRGRLTFVTVKENGTWLIASAQTTAILG